MNKTPINSDLGLVRTVKKNYFYLFIGIIISNASVFLINIVLARNLTKPDYGMLMTIQYIVSIILLLMNFGVSEATTKIIAEKIGSNERPEAERIANASLKLMLCICLVFAALQVLLAGWISRIISDTDISFYIILTAAWGIPYFLAILNSAIVEGTQQMKYSYLVRNIFEPLKFLILIILLLSSALSVKNVFLYWTLVYAAGSLVLLLFVRFFFKLENLHFTWNTGGKTITLFRSSLPFYIPYIAPVLINMLLPVMIGRIRNPAEVAEFAAIIPFTSFTAILFMPLARTLLPAISHNYQRDYPAINRLSLSLFKAVGLINICLFLIIVFGGKWIILLFLGEKYLSSWPVLSVLILSVFFENYRFVLDPLLKGTHYVKTVSYLDYIRLGLLLVIGYFAIGRYGPLGAAITLCLITFPVLLIKIGYIRYRMGVKFGVIFLKEFIIIILLSVSAYFKLPAGLVLVGAGSIMFITRTVTREDLASCRNLLLRRSNT